MPHTLGIGVIGMGWMGQVHSRSYHAVNRYYADTGIQVRLVICADDVVERVQQAQSTLEFEQSTTDWRQVIKHPEVDVVNIAAPNFMHREIAVAAAEAGKHVFCEKPVGRSPQETVQIERAARQAGVMSFVGFNYRWAPLVQHAKQLIDDGRLGTLTHYRGRFFSMYGSNPYSLRTWRFDEQLAGLGTLGDLMPHVIDMAHLLAGPVRRVVSNRHTFIPQRPLPAPGQGTHFSTGQPGDPTAPVTNEDYVGALVEFENGVRGSLEACRVIVGPKCEMAFEIHGTQGAMRWNFERMNELELYLPGDEGLHDGYTKILGGPRYGDHERFNPGDGIGIGYEELKVIEAYNFLASIVENQQRAPSFAEARALAHVQSAMEHSWQSGQWEDASDIRFS